MGAKTTGTINGTTDISAQIIVDNDVVDQTTISKRSSPLTPGVGSGPV
jgi:hypothetical protein